MALVLSGRLLGHMYQCGMSSDGTLLANLCVCAWHEFRWDLAFTSTGSTEYLVRVHYQYVLVTQAISWVHIMAINRQVELFDVTVN